jgi:hypothetical protein
MGWMVFVNAAASPLTKRAGTVIATAIARPDSVFWILVMVGSWVCGRALFALRWSGA